jgi:hypothetical protein
MNEQEGFQLPQEFINRLAEYTQGYLLIVCNEAGEITACESFDTPVIKLGLFNFARMHVNAYHDYMDHKAFTAEQNCNSGDDDDDDDE